MHSVSKSVIRMRRAISEFKGVTLKTADEGGSYFDNIITMMKAQQQMLIKWQNQPVNKDLWPMAAYTVNACYVSTSNEIVFPAGILQAPLYDVNASREQNLGGIGYVIAHEITHAFDNNGAKFDKNTAMQPTGGRLKIMRHSSSCATMWFPTMTVSKPHPASPATVR